MFEQELAREPDADAFLRAESMSDYESAEETYKALVDRGSVLSMVNLGRLCEQEGNGTKGGNNEQPELWYKRAVDAGSAVATLYYGSFLFRIGAYDRAREIFSVGRSRGYSPSIVRLANLYLKGLGVERDYSKARALLEQAAELGNLWAKVALAAMTVTLGRTAIVRFKGLLMGIAAGVHLRIERWRDPYSERLKK